MTDERERLDTESEGRLTNVLVGLFLSCFGIFMILLGGGCGVMLIGTLTNSQGNGLWPFLLLALGVLGSGGFALFHGVRMISGRR